MIFKDMRNCTAANKLAASAGKVHGGLTVKCDTHKGLQFVFLGVYFYANYTKMQLSKSVVRQDRTKKQPRKVMIPT